MKSFAAFLIFFFTCTSWGRTWEILEIPGAKCGDGSSYHIFIDRRSSEKLTVEFMGGGACWDAWSCYGPLSRTWLHPIPKIPLFSTISSGYEGVSPVSEDTVVYLPYCTGDVFAGSHVAQYQMNLNVRHSGYQNTVQVFNFLHESGAIPFSLVKRVVVTGSSAGAIGAFIHAPTIDAFMPKDAERILLADSPGLHFGPNFWHKFSKKMFLDFRQVFARIGLEIDYDNGLVAPQMGHVCEVLNQWKIGVLQSTLDPVMSEGFGDISPQEHRSVIYSANGLPEAIKGAKNCSAWVPDVSQHTFMLLPFTATIKALGKTAKWYFKAVLSQLNPPSLVDRRKEHEKISK